MSAVLLSAMTLLSATMIEAEDRSDQWLLRDVSGEGPVAAFLSWNYASVIARAHCAGGRVVLQYFPDTGAAGSEVRPLSLIIDASTFPLVPSVDSMSREVHTLGAEGGRALRNARNIDLDAPNEMGEPWYMGHAPALVELARSCG